MSDNVENGVPVDAEPVEELRIEDLKRVQLRPGDVLIVRVDPDRIPRSPNDDRLMLDQFVVHPIRAALGPVQIVILDKSVELSVVSQSAVEVATGLPVPPQARGAS